MQKNTRIRLAHITTYPYTESIHTSGVSTYSRYLIKQLNKFSNLDQVVLANNEEKITANEVSFIKRVWKKNKFLIQLIIHLSKGNYNILHFQHELHLYGNYLSNLKLAILLLYCKIYKIPTIVTIHGIVEFSKITKEFVKENNSSLHPSLVKFGFKLFYIPILYLAQKLIVHNLAFKNIIIKDYLPNSSKKIFIIPHGTPTNYEIKPIDLLSVYKIPSQKKYFLFMGYLTGYKGLGKFIELYSNLLKKSFKYHDTHFIIGAGIHPKLKNNEKYMKNVYEYHQNLANRLLNKSNHTWVGFIPDNLIDSFYNLSQFTVYPYTVAMSASGPMSLSIGYGIPYIVSKPISQFCLDKNLVFEMNSESLEKCFENIFREDNLYKNLTINKQKEFNWRRLAYFYNNLYEDLNNFS